MHLDKHAYTHSHSSAHTHTVSHTLAYTHMHNNSTLSHCCIHSHSTHTHTYKQTSTNSNARHNSYSVSDWNVCVVGLRAGARPGEGTRMEWWTASQGLEWWTNVNRWPSVGASFAGKCVCVCVCVGLCVLLCVFAWYACLFLFLYLFVYLSMWYVYVYDLTKHFIWNKLPILTFSETFHH